MAYIGNTQQNQNYVPAIDYFSGNGSTTAFTLSRPVASVAQVQAVIENVPQNPGDAYTVSGNTITFTSAPPSGTNNIYVYYTSPNTQVVQPGQGTVGTTQMVDGVTVNFNDGSAAAPSITNTGDTNTGMFFPAADTIAFAEGGTESMRLDSSGNVGIGITPSAWGTGLSQKVIQVGPIATLSSLNGGGGNYQLNLSNNAFFDGSNWKYIVSDSANLYTQVNGAHRWSYVTSGTAGNTITFTEAMRIDSSGNVGIGTSSPSVKFQVNGEIRSTNGTEEVIVSGTNGSIEIVRTAGNPFIDFKSAIAEDFDCRIQQDNNGLAFSTGGNGAAPERMRITSAGGISFGSSGTNYGTSGQVLTSNGDAPPSWGSASSIGVGQTWQNVAGSRALNTTYTNSTGRAIMVSVTVNSTVAAGFNMRFFVDGVVMAADGNSQTASTYSTGSTQVIVPNGSTYYVPSAALSNGAGAILYWFELR